MNTIKINGTVYSGNGSLIVSGNKIIVDGKDVTPDAKEIKIDIKGDISMLTVDSCETVTVHGRVGKIKTMSGDVNIEGDVDGDISTMSGDVDCYNVSGKISTMSGDIKTRK